MCIPLCGNDETGYNYFVICTKSTDEYVSMASKSRTLGLLGHSELDCGFRFSYAGALAKKVHEDKLLVASAIARSIQRRRKVDFSLYTKHTVNKSGYFEMLVECHRSKKTASRREKWINQGYREQTYAKKTFDICENKMFKVRFGNMNLIFQN